MSWLDEYRLKLCTAEEAVACIRSGETVYIHPGCATPEALVRAMCGRAKQLEDVEVIHLKTLGCADYCRPEFAGSFRTTALFIGENVREAVQQGRADYMPVFLHEIEGLFESGRKPLDTALIQTSPPDRNGFLSLGVGVDCTLTAARRARRVIAAVNTQMPRTHGEGFIHVSRVDAIVEVNHPLAELCQKAPTAIERRIAENVASLIPDRATLQLGIGAVPDAVLACLADHHDLGLHTEMFSDGVIPLVESGVLNGAAKSLHPGKLIAGFVLGTRRLFEFIDDNPRFEFHPIEYVNDPGVISRNDRMVAVNSALQVDLTGQVCSDSIGTHPYSGFGGQVDFMRGAARSKGGRPIIALPSTAKDGTISRIAGVLSPGAGVVTSRADVHWVVTEHGAADLHGRTVRERAEALIRLADPKFRDDLVEFAYQAKYMQPALAPAGGPR